MTARIIPVPLPFDLPVDATSSVPRLVHAYLALGDDQLALVDTGVAASHETLVAALADLGKTPEDVVWVINTHAHGDHAGGNRRFHDVYGTPIASHERAARWIEDMALQERERPVFGFAQLVGGSTPVTRRLADGDVIDLGGLTLHVLHTPGHAPGLISLWCPEDGILLTGDAIPPTAGLPLYDDVAVSGRSLQRLLQLDGVAQLYHSHVAAPYEGAAAHQAVVDGLDYIMRLQAIVDDVKGSLGDEANLEAITRASLRRLGFADPPVMPLTLRTIAAHLQVVGNDDLQQ